ncbi:MAG: MFS transporter [Flavobacteriales bacterium]|nr:MFS transporter [Flavobacteriales bacterium]MCB9448961.1 MFS transporter [Flavobacteriales bacterium]
MINNYLQLDRNTLRVIAAQFFLQLINVSFLAVLLIYMTKEGYADHESAGYYSYRYLGVLLFALPVGILIRNTRLKPFLVAPGIMVPTCSLVMLYAIHAHISWLLYIGTFCWGMFFTFVQVTALPYILRNTHPSYRSEAFALSYSTWSLSGILGGSLIASLHAINPDMFTERSILTLLSCLGFLSLYFALRVTKDNGPEADVPKTFHWKQYDWHLIGRGMLPTLLIATGAGLTMQFISLFFYNVHQVDSYPFATLQAVALILVFISIIIVPSIKRNLGYRTAITTTQSLAVGALVVLATTEYYAGTSIALYIAFGAYLIRQPLMNMSNPMASELVMNYVGKKNQEIISALTSATWNGSWYISAILFKFMRMHGVPYVHILLTTAGLYLIGIFLYHKLINAYEASEQTRLSNTL